MNRKFLLLIPLFAVVIVAALVINGSVVIAPTEDVTEMPNIEAGEDAYAYVQLHGELSKRPLAGAPINNYQVQIYHPTFTVVSDLPGQPLWAARGHQGSDMRIILTLTAPDGTVGVQTISYGYDDLPIFRSTPTAGVASITIGGWFAVGAPGTYSMHMSGEEFVNGEWEIMDDESWQDHSYDTKPVVVP